MRTLLRKIACQGEARGIGRRAHDLGRVSNRDNFAIGLEQHYRGKFIRAPEAGDHLSAFAESGIDLPGARKARHLELRDTAANQRG
jgi:hypothetical protein